MIQVFRSLPVARATARVDALPPAASRYRQETTTLGWEERVKVRARRVSDEGFEFATVLARGQFLRGGDCFVFDAQGLVVRVVERSEPVLVIRPHTAQDAVRFSYHIGNSHQPVMFAGAEIVCPDVPGLEQVLVYHAIPFVRDSRPFTPIGQTPDHRHQVMP